MGTLAIGFRPGLVGPFFVAQGISSNSAAVGWRGSGAGGWCCAGCTHPRVVSSTSSTGLARSAAGGPVDQFHFVADLGETVTLANGRELRRGVGVASQVRQCDPRDKGATSIASHREPWWFECGRRRATHDYSAEHVDDEADVGQASPALVGTNVRSVTHNSLGAVAVKFRLTRSGAAQRLCRV